MMHVIPYNQVKNDNIIDLALGNGKASQNLIHNLHEFLLKCF
jgi:hypothetical protein